MYVLIFKNLFTILKNMYIWFKEYDIGYMCMQYILFEEHCASIGMNGDKWTESYERNQTNKIGRMKWDGMDKIGQTKLDIEQKLTNRTMMVTTL